MSTLNESPLQTPHFQTRFYLPNEPNHRAAYYSRCTCGHVTPERATQAETTLDQETHLREVGELVR